MMLGWRRAHPVYPRACGGTDYGIGVIVTLLRSIPAPAGEPPAPPKPGWLGKVYPRACGGTHPPLQGRLALLGLSPRLRGNLPYFC